MPGLRLLKASWARVAWDEGRSGDDGSAGKKVSTHAKPGKMESMAKGLKVTLEFPKRRVLYPNRLRRSIGHCNDPGVPRCPTMFPSRTVRPAFLSRCLAWVLP